MTSRLAAATATVCILSGSLASAQPSAGGSARGTVRDTQGAILPGVTVVMTSPDAPGAYKAVTDSQGTYRFADLPPGAYTLSASLSGFVTLEQRVLIRTGIDVTLDLTLQVGQFTETIEVRRDPPLLESTTATQAVNISGDLQQRLPLSEQGRWSDALILAPGVTSAETVENLKLFYVHGSDSDSHVTQVDGGNLTPVFTGTTDYLDVNPDIIEDLQIKTSGVDASSPLGVGAIINVATRSGTNTPTGAATIAFRDRDWNSSNLSDGTTRAVEQLQVDLSFGGPVIRDRMWAFGAYRRLDSTTGISRSPEQLEALRRLEPGFRPYDDRKEASNWFGKLTAQPHSRHRLEAYYQYDRSPSTAGNPSSARPFRSLLGGTGASVRLPSVWGSRLTSRLSASYNSKERSVDRFDTPVPFQAVYETVVPSAGRLLGTGVLASIGSPIIAWSRTPNTRVTVAGDLSYHQPSFFGSHDIQLGFYLEPRIHNETEAFRVNLGFVREDHVLVDRTGEHWTTQPFYRQVYSTESSPTTIRDTRDLAVYAQDSWRPRASLTLSLGIRADFLRQIDRLCESFLESDSRCTTQDSTDVGPRFGLNYQLTPGDVVRFSAGRVHDVPSQAAASTLTAVDEFRDLYDLDLDGQFETEFVNPGSAFLNPSRVLDPEWHQPFVDELTAEYQRQIPGHSTAGISLTRRWFRDRAALVESNGIYESNVLTGFRDEALNEVYRLTNNSWNQPVYTGIALTFSRVSGGAQLIASYLRQWRHIDGTWQPHDPASFIQPDAFPNNRGIGSTSGTTQVSEASSLSGAHMTGGGQWQDHVVRTALSYDAPWDLLVATSYTYQSGVWSGPIITRVDAPDPRFGPPTARLSNGRVVSNPLATTFRFAYPTRSEGQLRTAAYHAWNLRVGRRFHVSDLSIEAVVDAFNVVNHDADLSFEQGANQDFSPTFGQTVFRQTPRSFQISLRVRY